MPIDPGTTERLMRRHNSDKEGSYEKDEGSKSFLANVGLGIDLGLSLASNVLRMLPISKQLLGPPSESEAMINALVAQQKVATSYEEWKMLSLRLDALLGNEKWKDNPKSDIYDYELITLRINQFRYARSNRDYKKLLYLIRTTWNRNVGNIGDVSLYRHSLVGTKTLIEEYLKECEASLNFLMDDSVNTGIDDRYLLGMLLQTRRAIGRTALVLSGGGCFGLFHIGVLSTLLEQDLLPRVVSGSSAGAIVASILSAHHPEEIDDLLQDIMGKEFIIFNAPETQTGKPTKKSLFVNLLRFIKTGNWFENNYLVHTMKSFLGNLTFREAYNRTGRILNVTVSPASFYEQPRLLNYITSPNVLIWSAVCASCALPGVFASTIIYEKDPSLGIIREWNHISVKFVDGSVDNDLPITRLSEMFNVDHIIACQVNPHVTPFLKLSLAQVGGEIEHEFSYKVKKYFNAIYSYSTSEIIHYLDISQELGIARNMSKKIKSVLTQRYSGDITILPELRISELGNVLRNPTPQFLLDATVRGARSTWPKLSLIHNHCFFEFLLDKSISHLRTRLICKKVNMNGVPLAFVNSPVDSDNANSEEELLIKETLFGEKKQPNSIRRRQRSESLTFATFPTRSVSHGNIKGLHDSRLRRQSSISTIRNPRDTLSASNALNTGDTMNPTNTLLKYYSANSMPSSFVATGLRPTSDESTVLPNSRVLPNMKFNRGSATNLILNRPASPMATRPVSPMATRSPSKSLIDKPNKLKKGEKQFNFNVTLVNNSSADSSVNASSLEDETEPPSDFLYPVKMKAFKVQSTDNVSHDRTI